MATAGKAVLVSGLTVLAALSAVRSSRSRRSARCRSASGSPSCGARRHADAAARGALALGTRINGGRVRLLGAIDHRSAALRGAGAGACGRASAPPRRPRRWRSCSSSPCRSLGLRTGHAQHLDHSRASQTRATASGCSSGPSGRAPRHAAVVVPLAATRRPHSRRSCATAASRRCAPRERTSGAAPDPGDPERRADAAGARRSTASAARCRRARSSAAPPRSPTISSTRSLLAPPAGLRRAHRSRLRSCCSRSRAPLVASAASPRTCSRSPRPSASPLVFQDGTSPVARLEAARLRGRVGAALLRRHALRLAMDYTLFLLSTARRAYDRTGDPQHALWRACRHGARRSTRPPG